MKRYIFAMAVSQQDAKQQLLSISSIVTEHLIKLYLYAGSEYVSHWRQEVWSFLHSVPKIKSTKKYPSYKLIRYAVGAYEDMISELVVLVKDNYSELEVQRYDVAELEKLVVDYFDWISTNLAEKGFASRSDVYTKLEELGL